MMAPVLTFPTMDTKTASATMPSMESLLSPVWDVNLGANLFAMPYLFGNSATQQLLEPLSSSTVSHSNNGNGQWPQAESASPPANVMYDWGYSQAPLYPSPPSSHSPGSTGMSSFSSPAPPHGQVMAQSTCPTASQVQDLARIFFTTCHQFLPCIHQQSFMDQISDVSPSMQRDPRFWAIVAVAAYQRYDVLDSQQATWICRATELVDSNIKSMANPVETLQACVWIIYQSYVTASMTEMWVFLGKACRFANLLGFDKVDCNITAPSPFAPSPCQTQEKETRRKIMWALLFLDRHMSCLAGWSLAVDDRQFQVHFPASDAIYQCQHLNFSASCTASGRCFMSVAY
jgi:Fungal specific transcription factor domain